jgi:hypothetical protein
MKLLEVPLIGRFGNLLFIYAYARAWAEREGYDLCLHPWIGEKVFQLPEAVRPNNFKADLVWPERMYQDQGSLIYSRRQAREWFQFKPDILAALEPARARGLVLNVRQADDYRAAGLVTLSAKCYEDAATQRGYTHWELETDLAPTRLPGFDGDISAGGLGVTPVAMPSFFKLMTAPVLFRANSTFSWWAATLGTGKVFAPIITGCKGGVKDEYCAHFVEGNWPVMANNLPNTNLYLRE